MNVSYECMKNAITYNIETEHLHTHIPASSQSCIAKQVNGDCMAWMRHSCCSVILKCTWKSNFLAICLTHSMCFKQQQQTHKYTHRKRLILLWIIGSQPIPRGAECKPSLSVWKQVFFCSLPRHTQLKRPNTWVNVTWLLSFPRLDKCKVPVS